MPVFAQEGYDAAAFATRGLAEPKQAQPAKAGGARRDRTADLVIANDALSQLSYGPITTALIDSGGQQTAPFTVRAKAKSRTAKSRFSALFAGDFPCLRGTEPIFSKNSIPRSNPRASQPCAPFSTSFSSFSISTSGC